MSLCRALALAVLVATATATSSSPEKMLAQPTEEYLSKLEVYSEYAIDAIDGIQEAVSGMQILLSSTANMANMGLVIPGLGPLKAVFIFVNIIAKIAGAASAAKAQAKMQQSIDEIDRKLGVMYKELGIVEENLKSSIEFNTWMVKYSEWQQNIQNGQAKLLDVYNMAKVTYNEQEKMKLFNEFMIVYQELQIEASFNNLYAAASKSSASRPNMFRLYVKEKGCLSHELTRLYLTIDKLLASATVQMSVYNFLKFADWDRSQKPINDLYSKMYEVREVYYVNMWKCVDNYDITAKNEMREYIKKGGTDSYVLQQILSMKLPLYSWSTVVYKDWNNVLTCRHYHNNLKRYVYGNYDIHVYDEGKVEIADSGTAYMRVTDSADPTIGAVAVLAYVNNTNLHEVDCFRVEDAGTMAFFPTSFARATSNQTLSSDLCPKQRKARIQQTVDSDIFCRPRCFQCSNAQNIGFLAAGLEGESDPCGSVNTCHSGGRCRVIPHTDQHYCECPRFRDGPNCENEVVPGTDDDAIGAIAFLRLSVQNFPGIPDIIDVYYESRALSRQIDKLQTWVKNNVEYTRLISLAGNTWSRISFIIAEHGKLKAGDTSEQVFQYRLSRLDKSVYYTISINDHLVLGTVQGQHGQDFLTTYKRALYDPTQGCSEEYRTSVDNLKKQIILTDKVLTEVWIKETTYQLEFRPAALQQETARMLHEEATRAVHRWEAYQPLWRETSCPTLQYPYLRNGCPSPFSHPGMRFFPDCGTAAYSSPAYVTCVRGKAGLEWMPRPTCVVYTWGPWTAWSRCSASCDDGTMIWRRKMMNGTSETKRWTCNMEACCQEKFGSFQCASGDCISQTWLCDGDMDCPGRDDEEGCSYLTSEIYVALWTVSKSRFIDGESYWMGMSHSGADPGYNQWFLMKKSRGKRGDPIRSGDVVGFRYRTEPKWLSCSRGRECRKRPCPGYDFTDKDHCTDELFTVYKIGFRTGALIYPYDKVGMKSHQTCCTNQWLAAGKIGYRYRVLTKSCPGHANSFSLSKSKSCRDEVWKIIP